VSDRDLRREGALSYIFRGFATRPPPGGHFPTNCPATGWRLGPAKDDVEQNDKRGLYNGFGDGLAQAFEFAVTPAIFGVIGYFIDRAIGTVPLFTIILSLLCVVGIFLKTWYVYDAAMKAHEEESPWASRQRSSTLPERQP
jgi:F0F1-type ATP synthase assembly protein I